MMIAEIVKYWGRMKGLFSIFLVWLLVRLAPEYQVLTMCAYNETCPIALVPFIFCHLLVGEDRSIVATRQRLNRPRKNKQMTKNKLKL